jgi:hypothetical protein
MTVNQIITDNIIKLIEGANTRPRLGNLLFVMTLIRSGLRNGTNTVLMKSLQNLGFIPFEAQPHLQRMIHCIQ